jgi:head-tail adaptor
MSPRPHLAAGVRNRQVIIQQLTELKGASGFPVESWTTLTTVQASKDDATGVERFAANQLSSPFDTTWQLPYLASLDPELVNVPKKRRLVYQGRVHDIVSATPIGLHRGLEIQTLAGGLLT